MRDDSFLPLITRPTRFTTTTATLIDNIMSNAFNDDLISGILIAAQDYRLGRASLTPDVDADRCAEQLLLMSFDKQRSAMYSGAIP